MQSERPCYPPRVRYLNCFSSFKGPLEASCTAVASECVNLTEGITKCAREDFDRMKDAVLGHAPNRSPTYAQDFRRPFLRHEQMLFNAVESRPGTFNPALNQALHDSAFRRRQRGIGCQHGLKNGATGSVHGAVAVTL